MKFVIPARKHSKGFRFKNRYLMGTSFDFLKSIKPKDIIVTTDDEYIEHEAKQRGYTVIWRSSNLGDDKTSMKSVLLDVTGKCKLDLEEELVVLYMTYPKRTIKDLNKAIDTFYNKNCYSLLCAEPILTHPYMTIGDDNKPFIKHNLYRRQDYPKAKEISHYICIISVKELYNVNNQLYNSKTYFFDIDRIEDVDEFNESVISRVQDRYLEMDRLKKFIEGKTVCLVANSKLLKETKVGKHIDSFDFVVRFNSYIIDPPHTGTKIDIHATIYLQGYNLEQTVNTRIVVANDKNHWQKFIKDRIINSCQYDILEHLSNKDLEIKNMLPTTGFFVFTLFEKLKVYKRLSLIGFNFYEHGDRDIYRQEMSYGISKAHSYKKERNIVMQKLKRISKYEYSNY